MKMPVRSIIRAPKGKLLIACDLSQAESWIVAYLADERNMKQALMYSDIHTETAANALFHIPMDEVTKETRYIGKRYNHASAYRMKAERAAQVINKDSDKPPFVTVTLSQSRVFSKDWHSYYNLKNWWAEIDEKMNRNRTIVTSYGRKRVFYEAYGPELLKQATAHEPQSTVADHFNGALQPGNEIPGGLTEIYKKLVKPSNGEVLLLNQSHDSCMLEVPSSSARDLVLEVKSLLYRPVVVRGESVMIPVDAEMGEWWGEFEKVKS